MTIIRLIPNGEEKEVEVSVVLPHVEVTDVKNAEEQFDITGYGTVSAFRSVDIATEVQGRLEEGTSLKPGVKFRSGELIFKVNDTDARYAIRARKSSFINLVAGITPDIKTDYPDQLDKWQEYLESIRLDEPLPQLPSWKTEKEKIFLSTRNVLTEYFSIKSQEEQLKEYYVYAPFSGTISEVFLTDFSVVNPGVKVARLVETGNYEIPVSVPVGRLHLLEPGTRAMLYTTDGISRGEGKVLRISQVINQKTQSVDVFVKPTMSEGQAFFEGEYLEVRIEEKGTYNGFRLPHGAVDAGEVLVYNKKDSTLTARKVTVLDNNEEGIFVGGLENGQLVVTQTVEGYSEKTKYGIVKRK
jgi:multidrug efflux pump subunit AcrA (membrane-fusion protein)